MTERRQTTGWRVLQWTGVATRGLLLTVGIVALAVGLGVLLWSHGQPKAENLLLLFVLVFVALPALAIGTLAIGAVVIGWLAGWATSRLARPWGSRTRDVSDASDEPAGGRSA
jgi:hypothetical protein